MKLGACYNVFDGIELLEASINSIRDNVDYINVVYQTTSNYGEKLNSEDILNSLVEKKLIDKLIFYSPVLKLSAKENEIRKRNIGLNDLKKYKCSHHMNLDVDEFYKSDELKFAKDEIVKHNYDATIVRHIRYYKYPTVQLIDEFDGYVDYAPCIYSVKSKLGNMNWKYKVDPSRQMQTSNIHLFPAKSVTMHHMCYIRDNIKLKFDNKSAKFNFTENLNTTLTNFNTYKEGDDVTMWFYKKYYTMKTNVVENIFNINL